MQFLFRLLHNYWSPSYMSFSWVVFPIRRGVRTVCVSPILHKIEFLAQLLEAAADGSFFLETLGLTWVGDGWAGRWDWYVPFVQEVRSNKLGSRAGRWNLNRKEEEKLCWHRHSSCRQHFGLDYLWWAFNPDKQVTGIFSYCRSFQNHGVIFI